MKLRLDTVVTAVALLVIVAAIPPAIVDTMQTGRVYLFSRQFLQELPQRFTGPGRLRFLPQPMLAILLRVRGGPMRRQGRESALPVRPALRR